MAKNKISVSFSEKYLYLYNVLKNKDNISGYICELIKNDLENKKTDDQILEEKVEKIVEKLLADKKISYEENKETINDEINKPSSEDIDTILGLF